MQDRNLFEYAVIRVVPRVEREEFMNVGVILYCAKHKYLRMMYQVDKERLLAFYPDIDLEGVEANLRSFQQICKGGKDAGPIGLLDAPSRFRWLTATRSTVVQTSKVHPGFCIDGDETVERLFKQLVE
ncbi:DUF3037 domain-containing protein [Mucilaginibacter psychrotolerans]|uniref:DUF3037 domain-containing protein n=1 Tax=Mucilaginibacter psychrotolerans TaxID=1524096 RepID=A0A4Y8SG70_9SPHI|nr:DUF3037 domain-containing protein [Mucilaginibacter psychrotolerans]TFF38043.1 DUF3037 domain-containing protein [Mucilaginibacter psychrotolerans]